MLVSWRGIGLEMDRDFFFVVFVILIKIFSRASTPASTPESAVLDESGGQVQGVLHRSR